MIQNKNDKNKSGIYIIKNKINNKVYVGKAINIYRRIKDHITALNSKHKNENRHLINSWNKYKRENFEYYVAEYIISDNVEELDQLLTERELFWMKNLNSLNRKYGYNLRFDSEGKCFVSDETRDKQSESQINRYKNEKERIKQSEKIIKDVVDQMTTAATANVETIISNAKLNGIIGQVVAESLSNNKETYTLDYNIALPFGRNAFGINVNNYVK